MHWPRLAAIVCAVLALGLLPGAAAAQEEDEEDGAVLVHVNSPLTIAQGEEVETAVVVNDELIVDGTVTGTAVVVNGDAIINGTVEEGVMAFNSDVTLGDDARVGGDVTVFNGDVMRAAGATVEGEVVEETGDFRFGWALTIFSILSWVGFTILVLVAGLLFAAVGGRQLAGAGGLLTGGFGGTVLWAVILWIGLPILAGIIFLTVVGIPLGLAILLFFLPVIWFLGYLVAGTRLGMAIVGAVRRGGQGGATIHPYLGAVVGLLILQIIFLVPFIGWLVVLIAGLLGAGALAYLAWRGWRGPPARAEEPAPATRRAAAGKK